MTEKRFTPPQHTVIVAGGITAIIETAVVHPLDTIKTRMQLGQGRAIVVFRNIVTQEGVRALYAGCSAAVAGSVPKSALRFGAYSQILKMLRTQPSAVDSELVVKVLAGLGCGVLEAVCVMTPVERFKVLLQTKKSPLEVVRNEGYGTLWKGTVPTVFRQGINNAVRFMTYDQALAALGERNTRSFMIAGACSGVMIGLTTNPFDVIKTSMQASQQQLSISSTVKLIICKHGYSHFLSGIVPRITRLALGQAVAFTTFEHIVDAVEWASQH